MTRSFRMFFRGSVRFVMIHPLRAWSIVVADSAQGPDGFRARGRRCVGRWERRFRVCTGMGGSGISIDNDERSVSSDMGEARQHGVKAQTPGKRQRDAHAALRRSAMANREWKARTTAALRRRARKGPDDRLTSDVENGGGG